MDEKRFDRLFESVGEIKSTCASIQSNLEYHIKRTDMLERKLEPVEDHVKFVKRAGALLIAVSLAAAGYLFG